jgi:hypothetical protein
MSTSKIEDLESRIQALEKRVTKLDDIEDIQRLQKSYGDYIQHWMFEEMGELFADSPDAELSILSGRFISKKSIVAYFTGLKAQYENPEFLHQLMQLSGIVDVAPDGKTAEGRWFAYGSFALMVGQGVRPLIVDGIYTSDYIKQDGVWKILKLTWYPLILTTQLESWVKKERLQTSGPGLYEKDVTKPEKPREFSPVYPSGYIVPFHFKHPVTGKKTDVEKHNAALKPVKNNNKW